MSRRFSRPVSSSSTVAAWPVRPMSARTASGSRRTSWPATRAVPLVGRLSVVIMRTVVVLPAPLGPSSPRTVPCGTEKLTSSTAVEVAEALDEVLGLDRRPSELFARRSGARR